MSEKQLSLFNANVEAELLLCPIDNIEFDNRNGISVKEQAQIFNSIRGIISNNSIKYLDKLTYSYIKGLGISARVDFNNFKSFHSEPDTLYMLLSQCEEKLSDLTDKSLLDEHLYQLLKSQADKVAYELFSSFTMRVLV